MQKKPKDTHIIDTLIKERAPKLLGMPLFGPLALLVLYPMLNYRRVIKIVDAMSAKTDGHLAFQLFCDDVGIDLHLRGQEHLPVTGAAMVVANHPTGICDGVALYTAIKKVRSDFVFLANKDALRAVPPLKDIMIPIEWQIDKRNYRSSRNATVAIINAIRQGKVIVIFPAGRLATRGPDGRLQERAWNSTAVRLANKYDLPVVPAHLGSRNSRLYYFLCKASTQLRDVAIFHEAFNKSHEPFNVEFAPVIAGQDLGGDLNRLTQQLQDYTGSAFQTSFDC